MSAAAYLDRGHLLTGGQERDYNHVSDPEYKRLREQADLAYKKKQQLSSESQKAYKNGDGQRAHELSEAAKKQVDIAENYNFQAAEYVFVANNADSDFDEIDLHGLYVKEAQWVLKKRIVAGIQRHESKLEVIVGKGLHSQNGVAKLKPAVEELCDEAGFKSHIDPKNTGVLVINLANARIPQSWGNVTPISVGGQQGSYQPPQNAYQPQQQPQYQQQQQYNNNYNQGGYQQQQQHNNNNNNLIEKVAKVLLKLACQFINK